MKKIKMLQILVYISFAMYFIQNYVPAIYLGFKDGLADSTIDEVDSGHTSVPSGPAIFAVLQSNIIPGTKNNTLYIGNEYLLRSINISADIRVVNGDVKTPEWIKVCRVLLTVLLVRVLLYMASFINKVITDIYNGSMFEPQCIKLVIKTGVYALIYCIADYAYQWLDYLKQTVLIHGPLKLVNTVDFNFGLLLGAILIFILAEAFKQGARLKQEQELTI